MAARDRAWFPGFAGVTLIVMVRLVPLLGLVMACDQRQPEVAAASRNLNEWYIGDCGCGCCGGPGLPDRGDPGTCLTPEQLEDKKRSDAENRPPPARCAAVGCSRGRVYRVCDPAVGPLILVQDFAPPRVVIEMPTAATASWRVGDGVSIAGTEYTIENVNWSARGDLADQITLDRAPPRVVPAGTPVVYRRKPPGAPSSGRVP